MYMFLICSSLDGHLRGFHTLANSNSAAITIWVQRSPWHSDFSSSGYIAYNEAAESSSSSISTFLRKISKCSPWKIACLHSSQQLCKPLFFFYIHAIFPFLSLILAFLAGVRWYPIMVLICISLMISEDGLLNRFLGLQEGVQGCGLDRPSHLGITIWLLFKLMSWWKLICFPGYVWTESLRERFSAARPRISGQCYLLSRSFSEAHPIAKGCLGGCFQGLRWILSWFKDRRSWSIDT